MPLRYVLLYFYTLNCLWLMFVKCKRANIGVNKICVGVRYEKCTMLGITMVIMVNYFFHWVGACRRLVVSKYWNTQCLFPPLFLPTQDFVGGAYFPFPWLLVRRRKILGNFGIPCWPQILGVARNGLLFLHGGVPIIFIMSFVMIPLFSPLLVIGLSPAPL